MINRILPMKKLRQEEIPITGVEVEFEPRQSVSRTHGLNPFPHCASRAEHYGGHLWTPWTPTVLPALGL